MRVGGVGFPARAARRSIEKRGRKKYAMIRARKSPKQQPTSPTNNASPFGGEFLARAAIRRRREKGRKRRGGDLPSTARLPSPSSPVHSYATSCKVRSSLEDDFYEGSCILGKKEGASSSFIVLGRGSDRDRRC